MPLALFISTESTPLDFESLGSKSPSVPQNRCPNWQKLSFVKDLFWQVEEAVMPPRPPKSDYLNCHPFCLHI